MEQLRSAFSARTSQAEKPVIAFIGMSNMGKGHWSRILSAAYGYRHIEFDDEIGQSPDMTALVKDYPGKDNAEKLGHYFGMPWTPGFQEREDRYLRIERALMAQNYTPGTILDLTGSAIYCPDEMKAISKYALVIYLNGNEAARREMFERYISNPKAVCWKGGFRPLAGESNEAALARCYPILLQTRAVLYAQYADITIPYERHKSMMTAEEFAADVMARISAAAGHSKNKNSPQP